MGAKKQKLGSLSNGRPPMVKSARTMSRKASRSLINRHHQLEKQRRQASMSGNRIKEAELAREIESLGGLDQYQQASLQGQSLDRGGDTSKILLDWLPLADMRAVKGRLRMLEIGSLSTKNACSHSGFFEMVNIDLNSQEPGIEQQDFMERPLPSDDADRFDIISLSLVLNFVPDHSTRGQMLLRTLSFLRSTSEVNDAKLESVFPSLFLVLPRSCTDNSRYFTEARLAEIMGSLGYVRLQRKLTQKLAYSLWKWDGLTRKPTRSFSKTELNPGKTRNNFVITLNHKKVSS
ncbi:25S rRNA (adenine(2142)-N(1))-methyltransferase, bmt2 domain-containing protein [Sarocladium implicatum]|nr:25S rRNA (adenine(2142)-N(1))-methyltransferase, bmt2 domain-containing protein [Sarocladium implicatum]